MKPVDAIAIILTTSIALIIVGIIVATAVRDRVLSEASLKIFGDLVLASIAIIAFYVGNKTKGND